MGLCHFYSSTRCIHPPKRFSHNVYYMVVRVTAQKISDAFCLSRPRALSHYLHSTLRPTVALGAPLYSSSMYQWTQHSNEQVIYHGSGSWVPSLHIVRGAPKVTCLCCMKNLNLWSIIGILHFQDSLYLHWV